MTTPVAGADPAVVGPYLATALDEPAWTDCTVALITGGKSNLTYRVDSPAGSVVLRRPPLGHVLPTAHDMRRESTVMAALRDTPVPVPAVLDVCLDESVLGQPFYVMDLVQGHIVTTTFPPGYAESPQDKQTISEGLIDVLAALHAIEPASVGLSEFGRPGGYLARQVSRWTRQWDATRLEGLEALDALSQDLAAAVPVTPRSSIVHGDYRLDNTMLDPTRVGGISAVLDWEMSTLGDPLADLGILLVYWAQADDTGLRQGSTVVPSATVLPGFLTREQVAQGYAQRTGADVTPLPWYVSFAFFKLAVVCAGIVARVRGGAMVGGGFEGYEDRIGPLVELGRATLADRLLL